MQHYGKAFEAATDHDERMAGPTGSPNDQPKPAAALTGALIESGRQGATSRSKPPAKSSAGASRPPSPTVSPTVSKSRAPEPVERARHAASGSEAHGSADRAADGLGDPYRRVLADHQAAHANGASDLSVNRLPRPRMKLPTLKDVGFVVIGYLLFLIALLVVFQLLPFA